MTAKSFMFSTPPPHFNLLQSGENKTSGSKHESYNTKDLLLVSWI